MNEEVRKILKGFCYSVEHSHNSIEEMQECIYCEKNIAEAEKIIFELLKKNNNYLAEKLTHEHSRNQKLEKVVDVAKKIVTASDEEDALHKYYIYKSELQQALKELN